MAEVFVGSTVGAEGFSRKVAIKRVLPGFSDNAGFAKMFISEAQISAQLVHPNIVSVVDFDRDAEGRLFLVMELVDGKDLDALIATGLLPPRVVVYVIGEVLRGLGFAHDLPMGTGMRGIVHRDVSPHNVLMSWEGAVKVSDFGIAKARAASEATASVFIKGKPAYMSPEQANGQPLDGRSDLFAVGVMLWEMLVGERLFVAEDTRATLAAVLFGQIPRPRSVRADVPKDLERVTMKLLERDLPARYAAAEEAIADLMSCSDAPRSGREVLKAMLAERFPKVAPVRQSTARARAAPAPVAPVVPVAPKRTLPDSTGGPVATPAPTHPGDQRESAPLHVGPGPGLETVMSAQTATMDVRPQARLRPPRRPSLLLLVILVALASALLAFAVVSASRAAGPAEQSSQNKSSSQVPPGGTIAPLTTRIDGSPMTIIHGTR
jgi:serine/threonine protein kinase